MPADSADGSRHAHSARRRRPRRRLPRLITILLWIITAALGVVAVLRLVAWDALAPLAILNAGTIVLYLPAWPIAVVGAIGRRPYLAGAALVIAITQVLLVAPELSATQPIPTWAAHATAFTLMDANVYFENPTMDGYIDQIRTVRPDIATFEECTPNDMAQFRASGVFNRLPYQFEVYGADPFIFCIASKYPISHTYVAHLDREALVVQTVVALPSGPQSLWVVHTIAPLPASFDQWKAQVSDIDRLVRARGTKGLLLVGDFNSTWNNKGFRQILSTGLVDAAAARGHALDMTRSQLLGPLPPLIRIDHVLTGPGVTVPRITSGPGPGSDHRYLVARVAVR